MKYIKFYAKILAFTCSKSFPLELKLEASLILYMVTPIDDQYTHNARKRTDLLKLKAERIEGKTEQLI